MKRLLTILFLSFIVNYSFAQVKVNSEGDIIPTGIYPAVKSNNLKGTIHQFKSIEDRNALPANFRDTGMIAYVRDSAKYYYLYNGITNADWRDLFKASSAFGDIDVLQAPDSAYGDIKKIDGTHKYIVILADGTIGGSTGGGSTYTLPIASATILGGIKVGSGLAIDSSGVLSATGGGGTYTASNGLTMVGSDVQLGGNLIQNTTILNNGFDFKVQRNDASPAINVSNLSSGNAIYGSSTGDAIYGASSSGSGIVGISTSGMAVVGRSTSGVSGFFQLSSLSNNTVSTVVDINNNGSDGTSTGFGSSIDFALRNDGSDIRLSNQIISKWTTSTDASRTSEFSITGVNNAVTNTLLQISGAGVFTLTQGLTNYTDNAAAIAGGLTVGQLYRNGDVVQIVH